MRMPWPQFRLEPDLERRFLNAFVKLEQVRMPSADADPDDFHNSFRRKCSDGFYRQKEGAKLDRAEFFLKCKFDSLRHVREKTEREMDLIARRPAHALNMRIEIGQDFADGLRRIDRNEKAFHLPRLISAPDLASLPLALTCGGRERLNVPIARATKFGNTAFAAIIRYVENGITRFGLPRAQAFTIFRAARFIEIDASGIFRDLLNHPYSAP